MISLVRLVEAATETTVSGRFRWMECLTLLHALSEVFDSLKMILDDLLKAPLT